MALSISLVLLLGITAFFLWRTGYQRIGPGIVVCLFGFFLAHTGIAPTITHAVSSIARWLGAL